MCRNIRALYNFEPAATPAGIEEAALQFVRKVSGYRRPSAANEAAFDQAVAEVSAAVHRLLEGLTTSRPPKDREKEQRKARERAAKRYRG